MNTSPDTEPKNALTCLDERCYADLKAYVDGELSPLRRRAIEEHLRRCAFCREEKDVMKTITERLRGSENGAAPTVLSNDLRSRLLAVTPAGASGPSLPLWRQRPLMVFGGGGAALLASGLVFLSLQTNARVATPGAASAPRIAVDTVAVPGAATAVAADRHGWSGEIKGASADRAMSAPVSAAAPAASAMSAMSARADEDYLGKSAYPVASEKAAPVPQAAAKVSRSIAMSGRFAGAVAPVPEAELPPSDSERQVHREASVGLQVTGLEAASDRIEEMVKAGGGFVASNNLSTDDEGYKSAELSLRVPTKDFDSTLSSLAKLGNVVSKNISGEDITEKVSDATSAEQVLVNEVHETEEKLRNQSMSERRTGQKEAELRYTRIQLAQTRARLGLLRKMASLSTINVSLSEKPKKHAANTNTSGFWTDMHDTNRAAMAAFQSAVRVPIVLIVWILAFSPIWVPMVLVYRYMALRSLSQGNGKAEV